MQHIMSRQICTLILVWVRLSWASYSPYNCISWERHWMVQYISYRWLMHRQPGLDQEHQTSSIPNSNSPVSSEKMPIFLTLISWILWLISPYYDILELLRILMLHSSKIWKVCCRTGWGVTIVNVMAVHENPSWVLIWIISFKIA